MPIFNYETSNVYLASFLLYKGATLIDYDRPSLRRVVFRFRADEKLHWWVQLYCGNAAIAVVPGSLFASLRRLKSHIRRQPGKIVRPLLLPAPSSLLSPPDHVEH